MDVSRDLKFTRNFIFGAHCIKNRQEVLKRTDAKIILEFLDKFTIVALTERVTSWNFRVLVLFFEESEILPQMVIIAFRKGPLSIIQVKD